MICNRVYTMNPYQELLLMRTVYAITAGWLKDLRQSIKQGQVMAKKSLKELLMKSRELEQGKNTIVWLALVVGQRITNMPRL